MNKPRNILVRTAACTAAGVLCFASLAWAEPKDPHGPRPELIVSDFESVHLEPLNDVQDPEIVIDEGYEPGLFHTGLTQGSHDAVTGEIITQQTVIPAKDLDYALSYGSYGSDVYELQEKLIELGFLQGAADGSYGWYTQNAVSAFQQAYGMDNPDGVFGYWTLQVMRDGVSVESVEPYSDYTDDEAVEQQAHAASSISESDVYAVQEVLYDLGYLGVEPTGYFGDMTRSALALFQQDNGLAATMELDEQTMAALNSYSQPAESSYRQLYIGSFGDDVYALQAQLQALGFIDEAPDGMFGNRTRAAVESFQAAYGLEVTGAADTATLNFLYGTDNVYTDTVEDTYVEEDASGDETVISDEELAAIDEAYDEIVASNASLGQQIVDYAMQWVGVTPYVDYWERYDENGEFFNSLVYGTDCSGFCHLIYDAFGIYVPTGSDAYQYSVGVQISEDELLPGDIVVYRYGGHVGIYAGNGMLIHCSTPESGTVYADMWYDQPTAYVRVVF